MSDATSNICEGIYMREANNISNAVKNKQYMDRIRESLIKKSSDENNNEEIEFLLKRL
jgi:hypothetical protein